MSDLDEDRVRAKAHALWESENRPEGRAERHWMEAREIVALEDSYSSTLRPLEETVEDTVEPLIAVESHGDVPELTDLGDGRSVPSRQAAAQDADVSPLQPDIGGRSPKEK
ncbi:MAG: DUF2934 domain-containing protein [Aurantimonas endophytica]|uniref:DUF2934 domain-containing protein n=1 Tax=Aurantimonas endophytica TaxID=1522175 RepID=UPI003002338E